MRPDILIDGTPRGAPIFRRKIEAIRRTVALTALAAD
jgi:hypothetical protein